MLAALLMAAPIVGAVTEMKEMWRVTLPDDGEETWDVLPPTSADGRIIVTTTHRQVHHVFAHVYALNASTGAQEWQFRIAEPSGGPFAAAGVVFGTEFIFDPTDIANSYEQTFVHSADDGGFLWESRGHRFGAGSDGRLYGHASGDLVAVDAQNGDEIWRTDVPGTGALLAKDGTGPVYGATDAGGGHVYALHAEDGAMLWTQPVEGAKTLASTRSGLLVVGADQSVHALDAADGSPRWSRATDHPITAGPVVAAGWVITGDSEGVIRVLNEHNGRESWSFDPPGNLTWGPIAGNPDLFYGTDQGYGYSFDLAFGAEQGSFQVDDEVDAAPVELYGPLYFATDDREVFAIDPPRHDQDRHGDVHRAWLPMPPGLIVVILVAGLVAMARRRSSISESPGEISGDSR